MSVTWGGMVGVVSAMNKEGLTVTINAGKSKIPLVAKTPISLVTREILQFAKNTDEAIEIAKKRKVFVSESIMVGSANDINAIIIEVSPDNFGVYKVENSSKLLCTNHFQSEPYQHDKRNVKHIAESHSEYRYEKLQEILTDNPKMNPTKMAELLRNRSGLKNQSIGYGNEKALNQLLAHHAVVFSPQKKLVWVSSNPYQLGEFVCYDLNRIFSENRPKSGTLSSPEKNIPKDSFVDSKDFKNYLEYRKLNEQISKVTDSKTETLSDSFLESYIQLNPDFWLVYYKVGQYYYEKRDFVKAKKYFELALTKEITTVPDRKNVEELLRKTTQKLK